MPPSPPTFALGSERAARANASAAWAANAQLELTRQQPDPDPDPTQAKRVPLPPPCRSVPPLTSTGGTRERHCTPPPQLRPGPWAVSAQGEPTRQRPDPNASRVKRASPLLMLVLLQRQRRKHAAQADASAAQP